jgi:hypothetical protein
MPRQPNHKLRNTSRNVDSGHYVNPGSVNAAKPLLTVANLAKVRVFVNVPESEAPSATNKQGPRGESLICR